MITFLFRKLGNDWINFILIAKNLKLTSILYQKVAVRFLLYDLRYKDIELNALLI